ncbi:MAG: YHS domain-containing protein [Patescibacteria group bacterium]|nr:YHS domain-containing protein [Patescibacteria group bacterium]
MADEAKTKTRVKDPVCGKDVDPETAEYSANYKGKVYYFDSAECKSTFNEDPDQYAT